MPNRSRLTPLASLGLLAALVAAASAALGPPGEQPDRPADPRVSGPYHAANMTVFLVHGPDALPPRPLLTLPEAMEKNLVVVHETGSVNELSVENLSPDADVFLQYGDVIKGGRQDRAIARDTLLPPKSGRTPLGAFCVEQGRWQQRGGEVASRFHTCNVMVVQNAAKLAINNPAVGQGGVWKEVAALQGKLAENVGKDVRNAASPSSLQLALEDGEVQKRLAAYESALAKLPEAHGDAVGFAVAVNGKLESADVYGSADLFKRLWPRLLKSAAASALAESKGAAAPKPVTAAAVRQLLADGVAANPTEVPAAGTAVAEGRHRVNLNRAVNGEEVAVFYNRAEPRLADPAGGIVPQLNGPAPTPQGRQPVQEGMARIDLHAVDMQLPSVPQAPDGRRLTPGTPAAPEPTPVPRPAARPGNRVLQYDGTANQVIESRDNRDGAVLHRSYIVK